MVDGSGCGATGDESLISGDAARWPKTRRALQVPELPIQSGEICVPDWGTCPSLNALADGLSSLPGSSVRQGWAGRQPYCRRRRWTTGVEGSPVVWGGPGRKGSRWCGGRRWRTVGGIDGGKLMKRTVFFFTYRWQWWVICDSVEGQNGKILTDRKKAYCFYY